MKNISSFHIEGTIQPYAWGGYDFIAELTGREKDDPTQPWAEIWLGAHPKGPAKSEHGDLETVIAADPQKMLGETAAKRWNNRLPYLLKILDVREMLSIQAHPTKAAAEAGFAYEEANGPERTASNRNYRDDNHKPELGMALTDFYLLHGFKSAAEIRQTLDEITAWNQLIPHYEQGGVKALYKYVMEADQAEINQLLAPLSQELEAGDYRSSHVGFWAKRAFQQYTKDGNFDRGIFSIYWFNLVHLKPGQAIFQDAGIPHAYLEGVCVELMANSDNVLRGGLTVKHIDVPELMDKLSFEAVVPDILEATATADGWNAYKTAAPDFELAKRQMKAGESLQLLQDRATIYLLLSGELAFAGQTIKSGQAIFQAANTEIELNALSENTLLFRAYAQE